MEDSRNKWLKKKSKEDCNYINKYIYNLIKYSRRNFFYK